MNMQMALPFFIEDIVSIVRLDVDDQAHAVQELLSISNDMMCSRKRAWCMNST